jgi:hypothetical protein
MYAPLCTAVYEYAVINLTTVWVCRKDLPQTESVLMKYVLQRKKTPIIVLTDNIGRSLSMRALALGGAWNCFITCLFHFAQNYYGTNKRQN